MGVFQEKMVASVAALLAVEQADTTFRPTTQTSARDRSVTHVMRLGKLAGVVGWVG